MTDSKTNWLNDVVDGKHNDGDCEYIKNASFYNGIGCKYKDDTNEIKKLLRKVYVEDVKVKPPPQIQKQNQHILDLADYLQFHAHRKRNFKKHSNYVQESLFQGDHPIWIELEDPSLFVEHFKKTLKDEKDVLVLWDARLKPKLLDEIQDFCQAQDWRCYDHVSGKFKVDASIVILYDFEMFYLEPFTKAKNQLMIVTNQQTRR